MILSILLISISKKIRKDAVNLRANHKIPEGKITYSDLDKPNKVLFSKRYKVAGKPDYIIKKDKRYIPVELKTGKHNNPQKNHIFQLAGYCHLLEENYGGFVPYGILVYNNMYQYKIPFDPKTRFEFESTIKNMRNVIETGRIVRNHNDPYRCNGCSMQSYCDARLL